MNIKYKAVKNQIKINRLEKNISLTLCIDREFK